MQIAKTINEARQIITVQKKSRKTIGFVPTMGALHHGHVSLIKASKLSCDFTAVSIFVNPIQFGPNEDFNKYPRPIEKDLLLCENENVDLVFNPEPEEVIGNDMQAFVDINKLQDNLCGLKRPGHFRGVCTIVAKFINILKPNKVFFGKKDIQQLMIITKMVKDLNFNVEVVPCPTLRENDGLAMSSRNSYLSALERKDSIVLFKALKKAERLIKNNEKKADKIIDEISAVIKEVKSSKIDYVSIVDEKMENVKKIEKGNIIALAVFIGKTRLIDNYIVGEEL